MTAIRFIIVTAWLGLATVARASDATPGKASSGSTTSAKALEPGPDPVAPRVEFFDCVDQDKDLDGAASDGETLARLPGDRRLSLWKAGGPAGASWNAGDLRCEAAVRTECTRGKLALELRIGRALVGTRTLVLSSARKGEARFTVKEGVWRKNLDQTFGKKPVVSTAAFRLSAILTCEVPSEVAPDFARRRDYAAEATFVAGFASGE